MGLHGATWRAVQRKMIPGDSRFDDEGWHYGVMYHDGSVSDRWNGRTQRQRAEESIRESYAWCNARRPDGDYIDRFTLVRQRPGQPWQLVE